MGDRYITVPNYETIDLKLVLKEMLVVGDFTLYSGRESLLKFDIDKLNKETCEFLYNYIIATGYIGYIPAVIMQGASRFISKNRKHIQVWLEQDIAYIPFDNSEDHVFLIDDVVTTGNSMEQAERILNKHGIQVLDKVCLLNRGEYNCRSLIDRKNMLEWLGL